MCTIPSMQLLMAHKIQKQKENPDYCQDAYAYNPVRQRYAVADGVSNSLFPKEWAESLVEFFCHDASDLNTTILKTRAWSEWLRPVQERWKAIVQDRVERASVMDQLHLRNSITEGQPARATFIGLEIDQEVSKWKAAIIGDSCLFVLRENSLLVNYPFTSSHHFNNYPDSLSSIDRKPPNGLQIYEGELQEGDTFLLATDALSKYVFRQKEGNRLEVLLNDISTIDDWNGFYNFSEDKKSLGLLEDDDITLMLVGSTKRHIITGDPSISSAIANQEITRDATHMHAEGHVGQIRSTLLDEYFSRQPRPHQQESDILPQSSERVLGTGSSPSFSPSQSAKYQEESLDSTGPVQDSEVQVPEPGHQSPGSGTQTGGYSEHRPDTLSQGALSSRNNTLIDPDKSNVNTFVALFLIVVMVIILLLLVGFPDARWL